MLLGGWKGHPCWLVGKMYSPSLTVFGPASFPPSLKHITPLTEYSLSITVYSESGLCCRQGYSTAANTASVLYLAPECFRVN